MALTFRGPKETDIQYVISAWLHGARNWDCHTFMSNHDYYLYFRNEIIKLLASSFIRIACDDSDPDIILAWMVYSLTPAQDLILHFIYTRKDAGWKQGLAKSLIQSVYPDLSKPIITTTMCKNLFVPIHQKYPNLTYNPYIKPETNEDKRSQIQKSSSA